MSPIAALVVTDGGLVVQGNSAARSLLLGDSEATIGGTSLIGFLAADMHAEVSASLAMALGGDAVPEVLPVQVHRAVDNSGETMSLHMRRIDESRVLVQLTSCDGWRAVDRVLDEQQRFRSALLDLSKMAHAGTDDEDFYQHLLERAVEVVPGAQGGSVQLNIEGTTTFRFVAAVGFDLEALQRNVLDQAEFFRDTVDPEARIVHAFENHERTDEIDDWLHTAGRLSEIKANVSAPVVVAGKPIAFLSLDNFSDVGAFNEFSVEMTTVLSRMIGELWQRRQLEAEVRAEREAYRHLAHHDALTDLPNRRHLERVFVERLAAHKSSGFPTAVFFVDIDDFKQVNDELGHRAGDALLVAMGEMLTEAMRGADIVGRWGGDEFLVLPTRLTRQDQALGVARRLLEEATRPIDIGGNSRYRPALTIGIGWSEDSSHEAQQLVRAADDALYEAKEAGKGVVRLHLA